MKTAGSIIALMLAVPAGAQTATAPVTAPDAARLAAADRLLTVILPPARFQTMIDGMMKGIEANMLQAIRSNPAMATMFDGDARVRPIFERYMTRLTADSAAAMRVEQPAMMTAMARAYARRFTVAQMGEVEAFFATPTGQLYMDQGATIMTDPDVAAWQQRIARQQFARLPNAIATMTAELEALPPRPAK